MTRLRRFGGTPVAEGVRLEVGKYTVFAVRRADKDIAVRLRREPRALLRAGLRIPLLRGIVRLFRDIVRYFDGLAESAELKPQRVVRGNAAEQAVARAFKAHPQSVVTLMSALAVLVLAPVLLYAAPLGVRYALANYCELTNFAANCVVGAARVCALLIYVFVVGHLRVFDRLLMYRGAISKAVNCYECRDSMVTETARAYPRIARRSEAAYVLSVACWSLFFFGFIPNRAIWLYLPLRIAVILVVAALFNELYRAMEENEPEGFNRLLRAPMELMQLMTTREPNEQVMEVAVCAFQTALGEIVEVTEDDDSTVAE